MVDFYSVLRFRDSKNGAAFKKRYINWKKRGKINARTYTHTHGSFEHNFKLKKIPMATVQIGLGENSRWRRNFMTFNLKQGKSTHRHFGEKVKLRIFP